MPCAGTILYLPGLASVVTELIGQRQAETELPSPQHGTLTMALHCISVVN